MWNEGKERTPLRVFWANMNSFTTHDVYYLSSPFFSFPVSPNFHLASHNKVMDSNIIIKPRAFASYPRIRALQDSFTYFENIMVYGASEALRKDADLLSGYRVVEYLGVLTVRSFWSILTL